MIRFKTRICSLPERHLVLLQGAQVAIHILHVSVKLRYFGLNLRQHFLLPIYQALEPVIFLLSRSLILGDPLVHLVESIMLVVLVYDDFLKNLHTLPPLIIGLL